MEGMGEVVEHVNLLVPTFRVRTHARKQVNRAEKGCIESEKPV
jgi:hypothetical protein